MLLNLYQVHGRAKKGNLYCGTSNVGPVMSVRIEEVLSVLNSGGIAEGSPADYKFLHIRESTFRGFTVTFSS